MKIGNCAENSEWKKKRKMPKNISILRKFGTKQNKKFQNFIDHQNFFWLWSVLIESKKIMEWIKRKKLKKLNDHLNFHS